MSKSALALTSLVTAIPAGFACYVCVTAILGFSESMPVAMTAILWTLVVVCGILAGLPLWVLAFMKGEPKGTTPAAAPAAAKSNEEKSEPAAEAIESDGEEAFESEDESLDDEDGEKLFDDDGAADDDFDEAFNFDDEEDEAPKKKKKK